MDQSAQETSAVAGCPCLSCNISLSTLSMTFCPFSCSLLMSPESALPNIEVVLQILPGPFSAWRLYNFMPYKFHQISYASQSQTKDFLNTSPAHSTDDGNQSVRVQDPGNRYDDSYWSACNTSTRAATKSWHVTTSCSSSQWKSLQLEVKTILDKTMLIWLIWLITHHSLPKSSPFGANFGFSSWMLANLLKQWTQGSGSWKYWGSSRPQLASRWQPSIWAWPRKSLGHVPRNLERWTIASVDECIYTSDCNIYIYHYHIQYTISSHFI